MDNQPKRRPYFWPLVFFVAFILGAILWGLWMSKVIRQTRTNRENNFFVPHSNALPPGVTNSTPSAPNSPAQTNNAPR